MMNNGPGMGGFPPPNGNMMMGNQNWHNRPPPPRFNHPSCPWGPPQSSGPQRPNFNINQFMHPPHSNNMQGSGPGFVPDDIFGPNASNMQHQENFPFNMNSSQQHNAHHGNGPQFHGAPGRGRGFIRGGRGGQQNFRGHGHKRGNFSGGPQGRGGFGGNQHNQGGKKKKEKIDKRDLPENNLFFCDSCDRGFKTEEKYKEHVDGHIKCSYKDCPYIAAPKLVQLHMSMQHRSGMAKKVWSMESEEDVKKWREDRKRNFPTTENIARKKKERSERAARGEVLETKDFSKMKGGQGRDRGRGRGGRGKGRGRRRGRWRDHDWAGKDNDNVEDDDSDAPPEEVKIKRSRSSQDDSTAHNVEIESPEAKTPKLEKPVDTPPSAEKSAGGGLALLASYGDSSSEDEGSEGEEEGEIVKSGHVSQADGKNISSSESVDHTTMTAQGNKTSTSPKKTREYLPNPLSTNSSSLSSPSRTSSPTKSCRETTLRDSVSVKDKSDGNSESACAAENVTKRLEVNIEASVTNGSNDLKSLKSNSDSDHSGGGTPHSKRKKRGKRSHNKDGKDDDVKNDDNEAHQGYKREHNDGQTAGSQAKKRKKGQPAPPPQLRKYTLLEKLLAPDIRRERNKILQCVHYIVKNKFFESDVASKTMASKNNNVSSATGESA